MAKPKWYQEGGGEMPKVHWRKFCFFFMIALLITLFVITGSILQYYSEKTQALKEGRIETAKQRMFNVEDKNVLIRIPIEDSDRYFFIKTKMEGEQRFIDELLKINRSGGLTKYLHGEIKIGE